MFTKVVLSYLLLLTGYIAYILHTSAADQLHAGSLWLASFANLFLGVFTAFVNFDKNSSEAKKEELDEELDDEDN